MKTSLPLPWLLCVLLTATPAHADDFATAQSLLRDGRAGEALTILDDLSARYPNNVDYEFAAGQALARLGRYHEAQERLAAAIDLAPDYEAIWRERLNALKRTDNESELEAFRAESEEQFPNSTWWQPTPDELRSDWTLLAGAGFDELDNGQPGWNSQFIELQYKQSDSRQFHLRLARDARNRSDDTSAGAGFALTGTRWFGGGSLAAASNPAFQAELALDGHVGRALADGWVASISARHREYETATVTGIAANIERYFADYRIAYTINQSQLDGESGFASHVVTGNWYYADASNVGFSFGTGREAEAIGNGNVVETDVRSIAFNGRHELNPRVSLLWWAGLHEQGDLYRRQFVGLAIAIGL